MNPRKINFWMAQAKVLLFFDISRYLTEEYFDIVLRCHLPRDPPNGPPKINFWTAQGRVPVFYDIVTYVSKGRVPMRSTGSVEQPIELLYGLTYWSIHPISLLLVATLELTLHHLLPLRWRRLIHVSNQRKGVRPPLQCPGVLAIVTYVSKGRVPMRSTGSVEQPIQLLYGLTSWRARHCNVFVKRTRPNAVDRLGWTTYRATLRVDLLIYTSSFTFTCGYVGADATSSPSHYAGDGSSTSPTSARECVHHSNVLACSPL